MIIDTNRLPLLNTNQVIQDLIHNFSALLFTSSNGFTKELTLQLPPFRLMVFHLRI